MRIFLFLIFLTIVSVASARVPSSSFVPCARFLETISESSIQELRVTVCYGELNMDRYIPGSLVRPVQLTDAVIALKQQFIGFPRRQVVGDEQYSYMADLFVQASSMKHVNGTVLQLCKRELDKLYLDSVHKEIQEISDMTIESAGHGIDLYEKGVAVLRKALQQNHLPEEVKRSLYNMESLFVYRFMNILKQCRYVDTEIERRFLHAQELINSAKKKENKKE